MTSGAGHSRLLLEHGTWLGDVGVQGLDDAAILLFHHSALELKRKGEGAIVKRKILGKQRETLDGFILREMGGEALDFFLNDGVRPRMGDQFGVGRKFQTFIREPRSNGSRIRHDERGDEFALITNNNVVQDVRAGLQNVFNRLRRDKFSTGGLDQIFFAVGDVQIAVGIQIPDVAGAEPAVLGKHFARGFRILVITLHHTRTLHLNLAVFRDAHLHVGDRLTGTPRSVVRKVVGNNGRSFGQAVSLIDRHADGPEEFCKFLGKRRSTGANLAKSPAEAGADFLVHKPISEQPLELYREARVATAGLPMDRLVGNLHRPIENLPLQARIPGTLLHQASVNLLKEARNRRGESWADFYERLRDLINGRNVGKRTTLKKIDVSDDALIDMRKRQE